MTERTGGQILLISNVVDRELQHVRDKLSQAHYQLAAERDDIRSLLDQLVSHSDQAPAPRGLDLVGHSVEDCLLKIGSWTLDEDAPAYFETKLKRQLQALQITKVRLLGCSTATTDRSWKVITDIAGKLGEGTEVFGTRRLIDEFDYDAHGFSSENVLAGSRSPLPTLIRHPGIIDHTARRNTEHTCYAASAACAARRSAAVAV